METYSNIRPQTRLLSVRFGGRIRTSIEGGIFKLKIICLRVIMRIGKWDDTWRFYYINIYIQRQEAVGERGREVRKALHQLVLSKLRSNSDTRVADPEGYTT